tara:strand:- start:155 stop:835 length:681 start_codon:yes stop_codon:yes gene_type:complete
MTDFSILILSAGYGKRMQDLTLKTPKPLLRKKNKTLLENTINFFHEVGCKEFFINTHYLHKNIELFILNNFKEYPISLVYEPSILGTGGAIQNIFNYTNIKKICVVNSDIFWKSDNKLDVINFLKNYDEVTHCKIMLSKEKNFLGLKKNKGDFNIKNGNVSNWINGQDINIYSGLQIVSKKIFNNSSNNFSMYKIWNDLIVTNNLQGSFINSKVLHIGDKRSFDNF